jgi:NAD(P)-dependent dehydrogenase (short-subunit alcohol dehydrogenase family)
VGDPASVAAAGAAVAKASDSLDLVLNNAGIYGPRGGSLAELDEDAIRQVFDVNTLGPLRVTRALLPLLERGHSPRLAHMTSLMGSIADNGSGGSWPYRISKAALNMANRNIAHELEIKGIPSVVIHPGWVETDMGGSGAPLSIRESVEAMAGTLDAVTMEQRGAFLDRKGEPIAW